MKCSATMPRQISRIAEKYLKDPEIVKIEIKTRTADTIRQRFWPVTGRNKLDALTRILEAEEIDAMLIFVRTKTATVEISDKLEARGYACAALNGDIQQKQRERTVDNLKKGKLDIIVATDVAARGLDVARVSHVLNYDIPSDTEAYIHRIGRTGRAGRSGEAILFVAPREKRMKQTIERATGKSIDQMEMPTTDEINKQRIGRFKLRIKETIDNENLSFYEKLVEEFTAEYPDQSAAQVAAALAHQLQGDVPFLQPVSSRKHKQDDFNSDRSERRERSRKSDRNTDRATSRTPHDNSDRSSNTKHRDKPKTHSDNVQRHERQPHGDQNHGKPKIPMESFRIEVGQMHDVKASNIVGAIANEAGLESQYIGTIEIHDKYSTLQLPVGMPKAIFKDLKKVWVCGQKLQISKLKKEREAFAGNKENSRHESRSDKPRHHSDGDDRHGSKGKRKPSSNAKSFGSQKHRAPGGKPASGKHTGGKPKAGKSSGGKSSTGKPAFSKPKKAHSGSESSGKPSGSGKRQGNSAVKRKKQSSWIPIQRK